MFTGLASAVQTFIVLSIELISIQWISSRETNCVTHWIEIYPVNKKHYPAYLVRCFNPFVRRHIHEGLEGFLFPTHLPRSIKKDDTVL